MMKLKQIVCDKTDLHLTKEKKVVKYNDTFTIDDNSRATQILNTTYKGMPVVEVVEEETKKTTTKKKVNKK